MKNYAGNRLSPWLGHLMVSRQETARPLLTPGEVMQLPQDDELILVSGCNPIRAKKARYFLDQEFLGRILPPPRLPRSEAPPGTGDASSRPEVRGVGRGNCARSTRNRRSANSGIRREPELPKHEEIARNRLGRSGNSSRSRMSRMTARKGRAHFSATPKRMSVRPRSTSATK